MPLGKLQEIILLTLAEKGPDLPVSEIRGVLGEALGKPQSFGAVWGTVNRLVELKYAAVLTRPPKPERGGKRVKVYSIQPAGRRALKASQQALEKVRAHA